MEKVVTQSLSGWGRYPVETCQVFAPDQNTQLAGILQTGRQSSYIARGLGRSYGDTALNRDAGVVSQLNFRRVVSFDESGGVLECEAGVSLADIIRTFMPRGFFPPVVAGTKFVTVGGAVANDIHGKNHHRDGSFGNFVEQITLLRPDGEIISCSPAVSEGIFSATLGGIGLTGFVLGARLRLRRIESAFVKVDYHRARNLDEALQHFASPEDERYRYSVAWIDCLSKGAALGRAVLMRGDHAGAGELPPRLAASPLSSPPTPRWSVPFDLPAFTLNKLTVKLFNECFYRAHQTTTNRIVSAEKFFFPLDSVNNWNRLYGRRGFVQYQATFPPETSREGLIALLEQLSSSGQASFLAVLKRFGDAGAGLLSFPMRGFTLALDLPLTTETPALLGRLDEIVLRHQGRLYLAKDAALGADAFRQMYPHLKRFRAVKAAVDPENMLSSSMARRLRIMD